MRLTTQVSGRGSLSLLLFVKSHDVASGSEIMPCIKIDKSLVVYRYRFNNVHFNIAKKIKNLDVFVQISHF